MRSLDLWRKIQSQGQIRLNIELLIFLWFILQRLQEYILKAKEKIAEPNTIENEAGNMIEFDLSAKILYVHQLQHLLRIVGKDFNDVELMRIYEF